MIRLFDFLRYLVGHKITDFTATMMGNVPKFLFDMASLINPRIKYKLNKLLGDECYSSTKLKALGFKAQKTLKDMNETSF